jgi:hypothetical protein
MPYDLKEALVAVQSLADGAVRRRRGLDPNSEQYRLFTAELDAYARAIDALSQIGEQRATEFEVVYMGARTV